MNQTGLGPDAHGRGCQEMGSHAHERSRARAARELAVEPQSRMAGTNVARVMEWAMRP